MSCETAELKEFYVIGISVRTTNQNGQAQQDIAKLWEDFMTQNIIAQIPNKLSNDIYCMYTDYESDYKGYYTTILGCKASSLDNILSGLTGKHIPACRYRIYNAIGEMHSSVGVVWGEIWQAEADEKTKIDRCYLADFDVYGEKSQSPDSPEVDIYLSVNS